MLQHGFHDRCYEWNGQSGSVCGRYCVCWRVCGGNAGFLYAGDFARNADVWSRNSGKHRGGAVGEKNAATDADRYFCGTCGSACSGVLPCDTADEDYSCDNPDVGGCGGSRARFCNADVYARDCNTCYFTSRCVFRDICGTFDLRICAGNYAAAEGCKRV